jgi:membrane protein DedA with SNARE-associated domain
VRVPAAVFIATLSTVCLPLPEEATLLGAGYLARLGRAGFLECAGAALGAVLLGDVLAYLGGRTLLARLLRTRVGRWLLPEPRRVWAERLVSAHGARAIVVGRFLVGLRGFVYFAIGASRYPVARFLAVDAAAGLVEVTALVGVGFGFGELRARIGALVDLAVAGLLLAAFLGATIVRVRVKTDAAGS